MRCDCLLDKVSLQLIMTPSRKQRLTCGLFVHVTALLMPAAVDAAYDCVSEGQSGTMEHEAEHCYKHAVSFALILLIRPAGDRQEP